MTYTTTLSTYGNYDNDYTEHEVEMDFNLIEPSHPGTPASLNYPGDPPEPAEFEIEEIRLIVAKPDLQSKREHVVLIKLTEEQFRFLSPVCGRILEEAYEWAAENEHEL